MMRTCDICVIIQGPVINTKYGSTITNLGRLTTLGFGQVVFSTWKDEYINDLPLGVEVVLSKDPGSISDGKNVSNVNRQIVSVRNALDVARLKYVLKMRSDSFFGSLWLQNIILKEGQFVVSNITTKIPPRVRYLYHISDWIILAHFDDMKELFNIKLQENENIIPAEQYLWSQYSDRRFIGNSKKRFANLLENIHIVSYKSMEISSLKKGYRRFPFGDNGINGILHSELAKMNSIIVLLDRIKELFVYSFIQFYLWIRK